MTGDDPVHAADRAQPRRSAWRIQDEDLVPPVEDRPLLPELVDTLDREVTKQGIKVIEQYGQMLGQERDEQAQPLVEEYLQRRLQQHLQHLEDVANEGVGRMINPAGRAEEERDGEEK